MSGRIALTQATEALAITNIGLGDETMTVAVDGHTIIALDLNKDASRLFDLKVEALENNNFAIETTPSLDVGITFGMAPFKEDLAATLDVSLEDMPEFLMDETLGARLDGAETPRLETIGSDEEDFEVRVSAGVLTLSGSSLAEDVVIGEGMCIGSEDSASDDEEDEEDEHIFEGLMGLTCGL